MRWESIDSLEIYGGANALERVRDLLYGVVLRGTQRPCPSPSSRSNPASSSTCPISPSAPSRSATADPTTTVTSSRRSPAAPSCLNRRKRSASLPVPSRQTGARRIRHPRDGRVITPEMVMGELRLGTRLAALGDTGRDRQPGGAADGRRRAGDRVHLPGGGARHGKTVRPPHRQTGCRVRPPDRRRQAASSPTSAAATATRTSSPKPSPSSKTRVLRDFDSFFIKKTIKSRRNRSSSIFHGEAH